MGPFNHLNFDTIINHNYTFSDPTSKKYLISFRLTLRNIEKFIDSNSFKTLK